MRNSITVTKNMALAILALALCGVGQGRAGLMTYVGEDLHPTANPIERTNFENQLKTKRRMIGSG